MKKILAFALLLGIVAPTLAFAQDPYFHRHEAEVRCVGPNHHLRHGVGIRHDLRRRDWR